MTSENQIFQASSPSRWKRVKWTGRILFFFLLFVIAVVSLTLAFVNSMPAVNMLNEQFIAGKNGPHKTGKYQYFKDFLDKKEKEDSLAKLYGNINRTSGQFIRAAFYTPWSGSKSVPSLEHYGSSINTVFPEWFFVDPKDPGRFFTKIDSAGLAQMRLKQLRIMPMISNFNSDRKDANGNPSPAFDPALLHQILNDRQKQDQFIRQLIDTLALYKFNGINVDFEAIKESSGNALSNFQKNLFAQLHARGLTVTQDVPVGDDSYDYGQLAESNDNIVLMAYDQHSEPMEPGPVCAQKWIEDAVDSAAKKIDSKKIILGLAGYGYDWIKRTLPDGTVEDTVEALTYTEAIDKAGVAKAAIDFDNDSYNLHYSYTEKPNEAGDSITTINHEVWFTDAASSFNIMRFADEYGIAGTALWRMGSEDPRIWKFYGRDLNNAALQVFPFNFDSLATVPVNRDQKPTWVGEEGGEVLDILTTPQEGRIYFEIDKTEQLVAEEEYLQLPSGYVYEKKGEDTTEIGPGHKIVLTFDDGPSEDYTPQILNILEKEKIPATFFVVGLEAEKNLSLLERIYKDGFEIGNHTFTHHNIATMSPERAELELKLTRLLIEAMTGHSTILFRAPYNADSEPQTFDEIEPLARSKKDNYITIGESIDPNDWDANNNADSIFAKTIRQAEATNANIILLHDAGGIRQPTVDALPRIIKYFKDKGCVFSSVAGLMGKTKEEVMPAVKNNWENSFYFMLAKTIYWAGKIIFSLFIIGIFLSIGRMLLMAVLAWLQKKQEVKQGFIVPPVTHQPLVSIIVPAYNEEINAGRTVHSLLKQDYPSLEIIFVDDGSKDKTYETVAAEFSGNERVKVFSKPNGGKASALNFGIEKAAADIVVCIDADTQLNQSAVSLLVTQFFRESKKPVGAVAGNVKVGNEINMITRWQSIEYITSQNFDRRAFDRLDCITVVPGALGAFKKEAVIKAGGFTSDTLAEDCDLTMRLHRCGYAIRNCNEALSYTEAPETMKQFLKQRFRWSFGVIQCFWKHRDTVFNHRYKNFGMIAMPHILVFQLLLPLLAPLADLVLLFSLIAAAMNLIPASTGHIILYYVIFSVVDMAGAALAFAYEKENYKKLVWMIPQRFIYRQLMYYILFKSFSKALKGELQGWGTLKRTGNVKIRESASS